MTELPKNKTIILFDGFCNLCDSLIQFIIKHDYRDEFRFVSLQSNLGIEICSYLKIDTHKIDSIIYYEPENFFTIKSKAAFKIAKKLNSPYNLIAKFSFLPIIFTDFIYDTISRNRYQWFGKNDNCLVTNKNLMDKFLS